MSETRYKLESFHNDWAQLCVASTGGALPLNTLYVDENNCFCVGYNASDGEPICYDGDEPKYRLVLVYDVEGLSYDA